MHVQSTYQFDHWRNFSLDDCSPIAVLEVMIMSIASGGYFEVTVAFSLDQRTEPSIETVVLPQRRPTIESMENRNRYYFLCI